MITDLPHDTTMLHLAVGGLAHNLNAEGRYLDRVKASIDAGEHIAIDSDIARQLAADARDLSAMAATITQCRAALIGNATPRLRLIAAE